jgi:hypothetical protein
MRFDASIDQGESTRNEAGSIDLASNAAAGGSADSAPTKLAAKGPVGKLSKLTGTSVMELETLQRMQRVDVSRGVEYTSPTRTSPSSGADRSSLNFRSQYTVCGLSFLVLLLNKNIREEEQQAALRLSSLSSTDVRKGPPRLKECANMSKAEFVIQCLSIGEPQELLAEGLAAIYESLLQYPLAVPVRLPDQPAAHEIDVEFRTQAAFGIKLRADPDTRECMISAFQDFGQAEMEVVDMEEGQTLIGVCGQNVQGACKLVRAPPHRHIHQDARRGIW